MNTLRLLSLDGVQEANSGHPGLAPDEIKQFRQWGSMTMEHPDPGVVGTMFEIPERVEAAPCV